MSIIENSYYPNPKLKEITPELIEVIAKYNSVSAERDFILGLKQKGIEQNQIQMYVQENLLKFLLEFAVGIKKTHISYKLDSNNKLIYPGTNLQMEELMHEAVYKSDFGVREQSELEGWQKIQTMLSSGKFNQVLQLSAPDPNNDQYGDYGFLFWFTKNADNTITNHILKYDESARSLKKTRDLALNLRLGSTLLAEEAQVNTLLASPKGINADFPEIQQQLLSLGFSFNNDAELFEQALFKDLRFRQVYQIYLANLQGRYFNEKQAKYALAEMYSLAQDKAGMLGLLDRLISIPLIYRGGSCPVINYGMSSYNNARYLYNFEPFTCPKCSYISYRPVGDSCPNCKITKKEWEKITEDEICD